MDLYFANDELENDCNRFDRLVRKHNTQRAKLIRRRLDDLRAALNLNALRTLPGRCHELKGDRAGQLSVDLDGPYRLIFRPMHNPIPMKTDGGLDWTNVRAIEVLGVVDTHE